MAAPVPTYSDTDDLKKRMYEFVVTVFEDSSREDRSLPAVHIIGIVMGALTFLFFLATLCYSVITRGRGVYTKPILRYRPAQFIAVDKTSKKLASGGA